MSDLGRMPPSAFCPEADVRSRRGIPGNLRKANVSTWRHHMARSSLAQLAVLASPPVDGGVDHPLITSRLASDAGGDARQSRVRALWDLVTALNAIRRTLAMWEA